MPSLDAASPAAVAAPAPSAGSGAADAPAAPGPPSPAKPPLDDSGDGADRAETVAAELTRRSEVMLLRMHAALEDRQARLDRMKGDFDADQAVRAELMREMNVLRDMALEQMKKDDEYLKKMVSLI